MKTCLMTIFTLALIWDVLRFLFVRVNQLTLKLDLENYELSFKSMSEENRKEEQKDYDKLKQNTKQSIKDGEKFVHNIKKAMFFDSAMILVVLFF